jgi:hypothetical protein
VGNTVTARRTLDMGTPFFQAKEYPDIRDFFTKIATADQQPLVLLKADAAATSPAPAVAPTAEAAHGKSN